MRTSMALGISPLELLKGDPQVVSELMEVWGCDWAVKAMQTDPTQLSKAHYKLLMEMGWNQNGENMPEELVDQTDERWLLG